jgi:hypothetical protein
VILSCDVLVFDINYSLNDAKIAQQTLSAAVFHDNKKFIVISSFMTWAGTPIVYKEEKEEEEAAEVEEGGVPHKKPPKKYVIVPFSEKDKRKRVAHVNFNEHLNFEKSIIRDDNSHHGRLRTIVLGFLFLYFLCKIIFQCQEFYMVMERMYFISGSGWPGKV